MDRPSRSMMQQEKVKQEALKEGDFRLKSAYANKHPSLLTIPVATATEDFLKVFCEEHNLTYTVKGGYYFIT